MRASTTDLLSSSIQKVSDSQTMIAAAQRTVSNFASCREKNKLFEHLSPHERLYQSPIMRTVTNFATSDKKDHLKEAR